MCVSTLAPKAFPLAPKHGGGISQEAWRPPFSFLPLTLWGLEKEGETTAQWGTTVMRSKGALAGVSKDALEMI